MCLSTAGTIKTTAFVLLPWELACSSSWLRRKDESSLGHLQGELPYGAHIPTAASSTAGPLPAGQRSTVTVHSHPGERQQTQCRYSKISVGLCRASIITSGLRECTWCSVQTAAVLLKGFLCFPLCCHPSSLVPYAPPWGWEDNKMRLPKLMVRLWLPRYCIRTKAICLFIMFSLCLCNGFHRL